MQNARARDVVPCDHRDERVDMVAADFIAVIDRIRASTQLLEGTRP